MSTPSDATCRFTDAKTNRTWCVADTVAAPGGCTGLTAGRRLCYGGSIPTLCDSVVVVADHHGEACSIGFDLTFWIATKTRTLKFSYYSGDILFPSEPNIVC